MSAEELKEVINLLAKRAGEQEAVLREWGTSPNAFSEELWLLFDSVYSRTALNDDPEAQAAASLAKPIMDFFLEEQVNLVSIHESPAWSRLRELSGGVAIRLDQDGI
jgi:hypothetical protein